MTNIEPVMEELASIGESCKKMKTRLDELADSYFLEFSCSEMAAAEQLVQLSDHSDATSCCNTAAEVEICSSSSNSRSAAKAKIEEIFGSLEDDEEEEEEEDTRRWKKYGSLAEIYEKTKPLIDCRRQAVPRSMMSKKVKYF